jgi:hypothetical protein
VRKTSQGTAAPAARKTRTANHEEEEEGHPYLTGEGHRPPPGQSSPLAFRTELTRAAHLHWA